jgi:hypothetical protein
MAKRVDSTVLDAALNVIKTGAIRMTVCSQEPVTYGEIATYKLAEVTTASGDFTVGAGTGQGRKLTVAAKNAIPINVTGNATHLALHNNASVMHYVTTCALQSLTAAGTVNIPLWTIEIAAPT